MQYIDLNFWLRGDILRKADHISMANSLEVRVPYLDKEVWAIKFHFYQQICGSTKKQLSIFFEKWQQNPFLFKIVNEKNLVSLFP